MELSKQLQIANELKQVCRCDLDASRVMLGHSGNREANWLRSKLKWGTRPGSRATRRPIRHLTLYSRIAPAVTLQRERSGNRIK
jgi:hypothetical protein